MAKKNPQNAFLIAGKSVGGSSDNTGNGRVSGQAASEVGLAPDKETGEDGRSGSLRWGRGADSEV